MIAVAAASGWTAPGGLGRLGAPAADQGLSVRYFRPLVFAFVLLVFGLSGPGAGLVFAQGATSLYAGEVSVPDQSDGQRVEALRNALAQVVVKLTGDKGVLANEAVAKAVADAERYVQQYQYRQEVVADNGVPTIRLTLVAQFDRGAVDRLVRERGLKVWASAARPPLLTWIALDDGNGPRLVADANDAGARAMAQAGERRGVTLAWPALADDAQAALATQSVWDADVAGLSASASRYQTDSILIGQLRRVGDTWTARWTLAIAGQAQPAWESRDADLATVLAAGADGAADRVGGRGAAVPEERRITSTRVWISGLHSAQDYARVFGELGRNDLVRDFAPEQARGDGLLMKMTLNLALDRWLSYLPVDGALRLVSAQPPIDGVEATLALNP